METVVSMATPTKDQVKQLFSSFDVQQNKEKFKIHNVSDLPLQKASVLVPLFYKDGEIHILLTLRAKTMSSHAGQVAFPGGMAEPSDADAIATALREMEEEVGIRPSDVEVISVLTSFIVRPQSLVTPVLAILSKDFKLQINPREVEMVFDLPLKRFLSQQGRSVTNFNFDENLNLNTYHFLDVMHGRKVETWGLTALICLQVALIAFQSDQQISVFGENVTTKDNCFSTIAVQAIVNNYRAKL